MRSCYYLSNVRHDRFALEVRYLLPGYHEFGDLSNYIAVSSFFDVRVTSSSCSSSSSSEDLNIRRRRRRAAPAVVLGTITAWSLRDDGFGDEYEKGKTTTALIEELGRATFAEEQDCKLIQDLIKKANDLMSSMVSAALKRPDKFMPSLYFEEENDDSVVDIALSNHNHKQDRFASKKDKDYSLLNDDDNHNPPDNNERIHSMLVQLAEDTNKLFYSNCKKGKI